MFHNVIVRTPAASMTEGITTAGLGKPVYSLALEQHAAYIRALQACGVAVHVMDADPAFPDSCFVEDAAVLAAGLAVITNPGAVSRQGEERAVEAVLRRYYAADQIVHIQPPGTLEGGDIMRVGDCFYIGLSARTNVQGARQFLDHLRAHGYTGREVPLKEVLHLKTGLAYLEDGILLAAGEFTDHPLFRDFKIIPIDPRDAYSANCIWVNGTVLVPAGYPATTEKIEAAGLAVLEVDTSEFRKLDGGLSCLSLRF